MNQECAFCGRALEQAVRIYCEDCGRDHPACEGCRRELGDQVSAERLAA